MKTKALAPERQAVADAFQTHRQLMQQFLEAQDSYAKLSQVKALADAARARLAKLEQDNEEALLAWSQSASDSVPPSIDAQVLAKANQDVFEIASQERAAMTAIDRVVIQIHKLQADVEAAFVATISPRLAAMAHDAAREVGLLKAAQRDVRIREVRIEAIRNVLYEKGASVQDQSAVKIAEMTIDKFMVDERQKELQKVYKDTVDAYSTLFDSLSSNPESQLVSSKTYIEDFANA